MIFFGLCLWMPPKFKLLAFETCSIFIHWSFWPSGYMTKNKNLCKNDPACADLGLPLS
jgi:hypothetical protein